jgi:hypothetical protein
MSGNLSLGSCNHRVPEALYLPKGCADHSRGGLVLFDSGATAQYQQSPTDGRRETLLALKLRR